MPRQARLDIPGLLQHVIVRGIERGVVFCDDIDKSRFVERLSDLLVETDTDCFAWALIPNHFHLLLRPNRLELKQVMRRLLTGYAINFNIRHNRSGHVFQNRYKSIVCEEETYLLELLRYIHLNPLRAKLVPDLSSLAEYPWCGHSVLMGNQVRPGQVVDEVLARFGTTLDQSKQKYLEFIEDAVRQGRRDELVGGGLKRSNKMQTSSQNDIGIHDERVLGSEDFVKRLRSEQALQEKMLRGMSLMELVNRVEKCYGLEKNSIKRRSKNREVVAARDVFCYLAVRLLRYNGPNVGEVLSIGRSAVAHAVRRGEHIIEGNDDLKSTILSPSS